MFIFTAKFDKKKAVAIVLAIAVIVVAIVLLAGHRDRSTDGDGDRIAATPITVKSESDIADYLRSLGWDVSAAPIEVQQVVIPREFTEVYEEYNELQKAQGYDLSDYQGHEATRYTYEVLNYPGEEGRVVADIIVADEEIIAGDIQSVELGGFMIALH